MRAKLIRLLAGAGGRRSRRSGFTLTEVVVASSLLIVAMVPILKALTAAHLNSTKIERKTRSLTLAQAKLDDIKARAIYNYASNYNESDTELETNYLCNVKAAASGSNLKRITVSVGFDTSGNGALGGGETLVVLDTQVAKRW